MPKDSGLSAQERAAVKQRVAELRAEKVAQKQAEKAAAGRQLLESAIADMPAHEQELARRIDAIVTANAPELLAGTMYGAPAYKNSAGKTVLFFRSGTKDNYRYSTLAFQPDASLDQPTMWPTSYAVVALSDEDEALIADLVTRAVGRPTL